MNAAPLRVALPVAAALLTYPAPPVRADCDLGHAAAADGGRQILTLPQAAAFLQVNEALLHTAAERGEVPARRLLGAWRFSRAALIAWAAGSEDPAECFEPEAEGTVALDPIPARNPAAMLPAPAEAKLSPQEIAATTGTGLPHASRTVLAQPSVQAPTAPQDKEERTFPDAGKEPETFGEEPELGTAREVALREQLVLTRGGELTLEADLFYTRQERDLGSLQPIPFRGLFPILGKQKQEEFGAVLIGRYGIVDDLQATTSLPWLYRSDEITVATPTGETPISESSHEEFGDLGLGLQYALFAEGPHRPAVIVSADGRVPTDGSEAFALGGGLSLVKSIDPVALFASLSYLHTFNGDARATDELDPDNTIAAVAGFAFAMNERLSFSTAVTGVFNPRSEVGNVTLRSDEVYNLRFALTSLISESFYIEPSVSLRLNGPGDGVTFGLSLPYTF